ncbi:MAG TPA: hypothetical protein VGV57_00080 [Thermoleophilaceae bacterium]|nr:hypothetical protein [Thermoleophilaceae bacterium]
MVALEFLFSARNHSELEAVDATLGDPMTASAGRRNRRPHCDRHYHRLAEVMSFQTRWIAPPGSL